jgi:hypothetical protein
MFMLAALFALASCDENKFLEEKPLAIYTAENSLVTASDFQAAVNILYKRPGDMIFYSTGDDMFSLFHGTDLGFCSADVARLNTYSATMIPSNGMVRDLWNKLYGIVNQANLILTRIGNADIPDADKNVMRGEALFFRAFGYRMLANLFGGVPLVTEEITAPRRDFVRTTREETYTQAKNDLEEAVPLLGNIDAVKDGKISKQMAQHLLAEICISLGDYDRAISTATDVIDYPAVQLMTGRFGTKLDQPGDAYSDLFKTGNINRSSGNRETLWAVQYDYLNPASTGGDMWPWKMNPFYQNITVTEGDVTVTAFQLTAEKGGRSVAWMQPTLHVIYGIWEGDASDMRISEHNIIRDFRIENEASPAFGKWFVADGYSVQADPVRQWFPFVMTKVMGDIPEDFYVRDANGSPVLTAFGEHVVTASANNSFRDQYMCRLAETYLLRAEAHLGKNDRNAAAADINTVRARAQAAPVDPSEVDIDYLLDERLRELYYEEMRMVTLCRLGKLVDRTRKYNVTYTGLAGRIYESTGTSIQDYHNLWPIPFAEIERNIDAVMEQNPGYTN